MDRTVDDQRPNLVLLPVRDFLTLCICEPVTLWLSDPVPL